MKSIIILLFINALLISKVSAYDYSSESADISEEELEQIGEEIIQAEIIDKAIEEEMIEEAEAKIGEAQAYREELELLDESFGNNANPEVIAVKEEILTNELGALEDGIDLAVQAMRSAIEADLIQREISVLEADNNFSEDPFVAQAQANELEDVLRLMELAAQLQFMASQYDSEASLLDAEVKNLKAETDIDPAVDVGIHERIDNDLENSVTLTEEAVKVEAVAEEKENQLTASMNSEQ